MTRSVSVENWYNLAFRSIISEHLIKHLDGTEYIIIYIILDFLNLFVQYINMLYVFEGVDRGMKISTIIKEVVFK